MATWLGRILLPTLISPTPLTMMPRVPSSQTSPQQPDQTLECHDHEVPALAGVAYAEAGHGRFAMLGFASVAADREPLVSDNFLHWAGLVP